MPITVQVNPVLSDAAVQQIREIVRDEIVKASAPPSMPKDEQDALLRNIVRHAEGRDEV